MSFKTLMAEVPFSSAWDKPSTNFIIAFEGSFLNKSANSAFVNPATFEKFSKAIADLSASLYIERSCVFVNPI